MHNVGVFDRDRMWRTGCSASGSGMKFGYGGRRERRGGRGPRRNIDFGPNGDDYYLSEDAGPHNWL